MTLSIRQVLRFTLLLGAISFGLPGCSKAPPAPPPPLAAEQIPAEMQTAFAKAGPELKAKVGEILQQFQGKDYPAAYQGVNSLFSMPGITPAQSTLAGRVMLTLSGLMQAAQAQGDQNSSAMLEYIKRNK